MTTDVDLANEAILAVGGRGEIARMNEQSNAARYARTFYQTTLDDIQRAAHWNFARKTDYLSQLKAAPGAPGNTAAGTQNWDPATQPPPPWLYEYQYPADCLKMRFISPQVAPNAFTGTPISSVPSFVPVPYYTLQPQRFLEALDDKLKDGPQKVILTNQFQAIGVWTTRVTNPDLWDARFKLAFVSALGVRMCIPLSGDKGLAAAAKATAKEMILDARVTDGNEGLTFGPDTQRVPDWIAARGYEGDWAVGGSMFGGYTNPGYLLI